MIDMTQSDGRLWEIEESKECLLTLSNLLDFLVILHLALGWQR